MKLEYVGKLTEGYYNNMKAGYPVFIDHKSLSDIVKDLLAANGLDNNFCFEYHKCHPNSSRAKRQHDNNLMQGQVGNPLLGKKVRLVLEIEGA